MLRYLNKKYILVCFLVFSLNISNAQKLTKQDKKTWFKADVEFEQGDYLNALKKYEELIKIDSNNQMIRYNLGVCYYELKKNKEISFKYLSNLSSKKFKEVDYYLGRLNQSNRNYDVAIANFNDYQKIKGDKLHKPKEIDDLIAKCNTAKLFENNADKSIKIENLGANINSIYADYTPLISAEENILFFTSRRQNSVWTRKDPFGDYYENIFYSKKVDDNWQTPEMLDTNINTDYHDACTGISMDGTKLLMFRTSSDLKSGNIYESFFNNKTWSSPVVLDQNINSDKYTETSACFSPDGNTIYFSSNRPGGYGGNDIYSVKLLSNGKWGEPFNLGAQVNTEYNERSPFVHPSGEMLFFSSEGHQNMGGYDIFKSNFDESGTFGSPVNLGFPINTEDDDAFFVLNADSSIGYFSSEREGGFGSHDIYRVIFSENNLPYKVYAVKVYDESNNLINKVEIEMIESLSKRITGKYKSNEYSGKTVIISTSNKEYDLIIKSEGYEPLAKKVVLTNENSSDNMMFSLKKKKDE